MAPKKTLLTYNDIHERVRVLADHLIENYSPEMRSTFYGVPRGGVPVALMLVNHLEARGERSLIVSDPSAANIFVDDIIESGGTRVAFHTKYGRVPFVALITKQPGDPWIVFPWELDDEANGPTNSITRMLQFIGEDPNREGLLDTPNRVVKSWSKLYGGYKETPEMHMTTFADGTCDEMVVLRDIEFYSNCEHHMQPFFGKAHIAYIPEGKVIGISKLARILEVYTRRLQIQERIGQQVTEAIDVHLNPKGAACILEAKHFCMVCRGVEKQNSVMTTSSLTGAFKNDPATRAELFGIIRQ